MKNLCVMALFTILILSTIFQQYSLTFYVQLEFWGLILKRFRKTLGEYK